MVGEFAVYRLVGFSAWQLLRINTMAYASHTATETALIKSQGFVERLVKAFADYREYSRTYNELNALSDRELTDLGISRVSVRDVAYDAVYGNK